MSDIYEKVLGDKDWFKKIVEKIPGFKGYIERGDRRESDKILRENVANQFEAQYQRISGIQRDLISQGGLMYVDDLEVAAIKIRQFIDRVRTASYGYAGLFDAIKIREDELATVYQYDAHLLEFEQELVRAIDNVEVSVGSDGLPAALKHLTTVAQGSVDAFNKRADILKGIAQ
ncbi:MAG TPA: hypothetical protein PKK82_03705 [Anaerolineaceae bacterium]|nr:hypothetical protein [Chloroflexota bacterium]HNY83940.1 hypothetical protein [Anaerolineaceae bacterium]